MDFGKMIGDLFSGVAYLVTAAGVKTLVMFIIAGATFKRRLLLKPSLRPILPARILPAKREKTR